MRIVLPIRRPDRRPAPDRPPAPDRRPAPADRQPYPANRRDRRRPAAVAAITAVATALVLAGCGGGSAASDGPTEDELVVYSGRNENLVRPILEQFAESTDTKVFVRYGDSAELAAQLLEEGERTPADVFFSQDAGALGALGKAGRLQRLPTRTLDQVEARFRADDGTWVGLSGRARVIAYDPEQVAAADVPKRVAELTDARWKDRVGYAPTNASFQAFVTAMRVLVGEAPTKQWLEGMRDNGIKAYDNNRAVLDAVNRGEVALGLINHYYWYEKVAEEGADAVRARIAWLDEDDPGALVNVAGAGILDGTDKAGPAQELIDFLLSERGQTYFAETTEEYPLAAGVAPKSELPPLAEVSGPDIDLSQLDSLQQTLALLEEVGLT